MVCLRTDWLQTQRERERETKVIVILSFVGFSGFLSIVGAVW